MASASAESARGTYLPPLSPAVTSAIGKVTSCQPDAARQPEAWVSSPLLHQVALQYSVNSHSARPWPQLQTNNFQTTDPPVPSPDQQSLLLLQPYSRHPHAYLIASNHTTYHFPRYSTTTVSRYVVSRQSPDTRNQAHNTHHHHV